VDEGSGPRVDFHAAEFSDASERALHLANLAEACSGKRPFAVGDVIRKPLLPHSSSSGLWLRSPSRGRQHSVFVKGENGRSSTVPRHREINDYMAWKICRDLGVPEL
jgi:mRNA interferase HicA